MLHALFYHQIVGQVPGDNYRSKLTNKDNLIETRIKLIILLLTESAGMQILNNFFQTLWPNILIDSPENIVY